MFNITNPVLIYKHFKWLRPIRLRFTPLRATRLFLIYNSFEECVALVVSGDSPAGQHGKLGCLCFLILKFNYFCVDIYS